MTKSVSKTYKDVLGRTHERYLGVAVVRPGVWRIIQLPEYRAVGRKTWPNTDAGRKQAEAAATLEAEKRGLRYAKIYAMAEKETK